MSIPLTILLLLMNIHAHAGLFDFFSEPDSCQESNLYEIPNSPFNKIPIQIQQGDTCYAYVENQLLSYHYASRGEEFRELSPMWLAYVYKKKTKDNLNTIGIGWGFESAIYLIDAGLCPRTVMEKAIKPYFSGPNPLKDLEMVLSSLDSKFSHTNQCESSPVEIDCGVQDHEINLEQFSIDFKKHLLNYTYMPILDELFKSCEQHLKKIDVPSGSHLNHNSTNLQSLDELTNQLLLSKKPLSLNVCLQVFTYPKYKMNKECGRHNSLIVGKRRNKGKCQLLIRDSNIWENIPWDRYYGKQGEVLGHWIDQEAISNTFFGLDWID